MDIFLIKEAIVAHGLDIDIEIFENGEEALNLISKLDEDENVPCPGLVLLDINLPRADGFEVLGRLRNSRRCAAIPVVVMTSSTAAFDHAKSSALGASDYFHKPSDYETFLTIGEVLRKHLK